MAIGRVERTYSSRGRLEAQRDGLTGREVLVLRWHCREEERVGPLRVDGACEGACADDDE